MPLITSRRTISPARLHHLIARIALVAGLLNVSALGQFTAAGSLKVINYPSGGQVVYGPLSNVSSLPQAMGFMLRTVHTTFGDRPQVGKFFQARGSNSVATFFSLTAKNGAMPITGLVIVTVPDGAPASAAVIYDGTRSFTKTANPMIKKLNEVWQPEGPSGGSSSGQPAPLRQTPFPDNSGSVGLPAGWRILAGGGGSVHAEGPNGSQIHYGVTIPVMDPTNPQTRQMIQMETQGGRIPLPGSYVAYPAGGDPVRALIAIEAQASQKQRHPAPTYQISSVRDLGNAIGGHCTRAIGTIDRHDNKGVLSANTVICTTQPMNGQWMMTLYQDDIRPQLVAQEQPTMDAINASFRVNNQVIRQQTQGEIDNIHRIGDASRQQAEESHAAFDRRNAGLKANEDVRDRANQTFSNYQLDYSVITDTQTGEHATTYNSYADALVKADPNRYQYVPTQNFMKGVDY
jgi:hypothetical protein